MTGHTPGPWTATRTDVHAPKTPYVANCAVNGTLHQEEIAANSRLIAAAPDMLDALEAIYRHLVKNDKCFALMEELARAAIVKAKGKAKKA